MASPGQHINFDEWRILASTDPEAFEAMRAEVLQAVIDRAPEHRRQRLQGLQWRVDQVRRRSSSPLAACISLSDMMWDAFAGDRGLIERLRGVPDSRGNVTENASADVINIEASRTRPE